MVGRSASGACMLPEVVGRAESLSGPPPMSTTARWAMLKPWLLRIEELVEDYSELIGMLHSLPAVVSCCSAA